MNGFSAADMTTAAANGHRDGYQDAYADAVKAFEAGKPAAAQEAVAWFTDDHLSDKSATTYDASVAERWRAKGWPVTPLYAAPVAAAPAVGAVLTNPYSGEPRDYRDVESDPEGFLIVDPKKPLLAASTPAAPGIDLANEVESLRWQLERANNAIATLHSSQQLRDKVAGVLDASTPAAPGIGLHAPCTEAVYALARKLLWVAYVWNDHNFDHPYKIARKLAAEFGIESFDQANAWLDEQSKLIDASPKGGSDLAAVVREMEHPAVDLLEAPAPDVIRKWAKRIKQATSAEVGS